MSKQTKVQQNVPYRQSGLENASNKVLSVNFEVFGKVQGPYFYKLIPDYSLTFVLQVYILER